MKESTTHLLGVLFDSLRSRKIESGQVWADWWRRKIINGGLKKHTTRIPWSQLMTCHKQIRLATMIRHRIRPGVVKILNVQKNIPLNMSTTKTVLSYSNL